MEEAKKESKRKKITSSRKRTPYIKFCMETRPKIVKEYPEMSFTDIGKELGARWGKLTAAEKATYGDGKM